MKKRLGRRADYELYFFMFMLIMVGVVVLALFGFQKRVAEAELLDQLYLSRDLAMVLDVFPAAPGNVFFIYGNPFQRFNFTFEDDKNRPAVNVKSVYPYAVDKNFRFSRKKVIKQPTRLQFKNSVYFIDVGTDLSPDIRLFKYPKIKIGDKLTAAYEYKGEVPPGVTSVFNSFVQGVEKAKTTPEHNVYLLIKFIDEEKVEVFIPASNAARSRKLASVLLNVLLEKNKDLQNAAIHLSDDKQLTDVTEAAVLIQLHSKYAKAGVLKTTFQEYKNE